jgi:signal transduction histidine kinase
LAPLPSLVRVDELVDQVRGTGTTVTLEVAGSLSDVPQAVGISAYRIVQEGLTNALRHAPGAPIAVALEVAEDEVEVTVENGPARTPVSPSRGGGHGLVGIRERVHVLRGELSAGPTPSGGHRLRARLPLNSATVEAS